MGVRLVFCCAHTGNGSSTATASWGNLIDTQKCTSDFRNSLWLMESAKFEIALLLSPLFKNYEHLAKI